MASFTMILFLVFIFTVTIEGGSKKSIDKIIIHVPYKILKHHHIHTKYKVITVPAQQKENTIIYYKQPVQSHGGVKFPEFQHYPKIELEKQPEVFIPPHQISATGQTVNFEKPDIKDQPHIESQSFPQIVHDQKPIELHSGHVVQEGFTPSFSFKPIIQHEGFTPTFKHIVPSEGFIQKFPYKPMVPYHGLFNSKFSTKPIMFNIPQTTFTSTPFKPLTPAHKIPFLQDSVAHTSSHTYKTSNPKPYKNTYKVREPNQEDSHPSATQPFSNSLLKNSKLPLLKPNKIQKFSPINDNKYKTIKQSMLESDEPEYEHIGYLIIDGNSRKIVGKDFKSELRMWR